MFGRRHETELGEIHALARENSRRSQLVLAELEQQLAKNGQREPSPGANGGDPALLAFVHIPKTAGATATTMLRRAYSGAAIRDAGNYVRNPENVARKLTNLDAPRDARRRVTTGLRSPDRAA